MRTVTEMHIFSKFAQEPICTEALNQEMSVTQPGLLVNA